MYEYQLCDYLTNAAEPSNIGNLDGSYYLNSQPGDQQPTDSPAGNYLVLANALPGKTANLIIESSTGTNRRTLSTGYQPDWQSVG